MNAKTDFLILCLAASNSFWLTLFAWPTYPVIGLFSGCIAAACTIVLVVWLCSIFREWWTKQYNI